MWHEGSNESSTDENSDDGAVIEDQAQKADSPAGSSDDGSDYEDVIAKEAKVESSTDEEEEVVRVRTSSSSQSSDDSTKKRRPASKIDEKTTKLLEQNNYLRRSSRSKPTRKVDSSPEEESETDGSDEDIGRSLGYKKSTKSKRKAEQRFVKRATVKKKVNYAEKSDEEIDEDDVLEWEEEEPAVEEQNSNAETIEKILKARIGVAGATGSATTCYNVAEKGDPNIFRDDSLKEEQFLIKWVGWSHMHNTWESEVSLNRNKVKGLKKLQNFMKKEAELEMWKRTADREYVEFVECERERNEDLYEEYKVVERIVAHQVSRDRGADGREATEYFIKWNALSYSDCTWEDEKMIEQAKLDEYYRRVNYLRGPLKGTAVLKKRPRFEKLEYTPEYLRPPGREHQDLRDYQLQGLNWMLHAWCKGNSCILADEMGLGKTIQSISFLTTLYHRYELYGPFLVVVPLSTMAAWQKEFGQWGAHLNMVTYMGDGPAREQIRQFEWYMPGNKRLKVNAVLTTYEILLKDKPFLGSFQWAALLVDEAHRLKNDESLLYRSLSTFDCNHRLLITGTPLQNSLKELWALLHFIMPEKFDSWLDFENDHNDKDHKGISSLHRKLEPYLLRRVKKDVEKSLPPKLEQILRVDMTAQQKQYYKWILTKNYRELSKGVKGSISGFINLCMELKKCCNHSSLTRQYDYFESDPQSRLQQLLKSSGKLILLDKLLCRLKDTGHRVLIFSQMVMMLDILQEYLQLRRFPTQRLDGTMRADLRKQALDHFNAEGSTDFCFLLSTRAGGLGINLATADTVIIFDSDWNPQNDLQAMSRAHRIGQTKTVNIYRLVTKSSVEEDIVERAKRKLVLDHLVIQRMDTSGRMVLSKNSANGSVPFDKHELNDILKFGAAELFQEKEGEEKEPEVDIDRILMGAETRDAEESQEQGNELLNSFKYANFVFDEEKDIAAAAGPPSPGQDWDNIIPEDQRKKIEDEEKRKAAAELDLLPRNRKFMEVENKDSRESDSSEDSDEEGGTKKKKKKAWGEFSGAEVKRFIRSFRKFAKPLERLEALAVDAELEDHSNAEMKKIVETVLEGCIRAEEEFSKRKPEADEETEKKEKAKGPTFKFGGAEVNVKQIRRMHDELEPLHSLLKSNEQAPLPLVQKAKPQKGWDVEWGPADDEAILRGIFKYGMGSWEAVKMDPKLGLADKIFLKEKVKKPQRSHVQARLEFLLKLLKKTSPVKQVKKKKETKEMKERKRKHEEEKKPAVEKKKEKKTEEKEEKDLDSFVDRLFAIQIDKSLYGAPLEDKASKSFTECVIMVKPVQKYLRKIAAGGENSTKFLVKLGNHCAEELERLHVKKPQLNLTKWYNYIWIFISKFIPDSEPAEMAEKWREHTRKHHGRHKKNGKSKEVKEEKHKHQHKEKEQKEEKHKERAKDERHKEKAKEHKNHEKKEHREKEHKEHREHKEKKKDKERDREKDRDKEKRRKEEKRERREDRHSSSRSFAAPFSSNSFLSPPPPLPTLPVPMGASFSPLLPRPPLPPSLPVPPS